MDYVELAKQIKTWGREIGFQAVAIADTDLRLTEQRLADWLAMGYQGEMAYMSRHGSKRTRPAELLAGTTRVICVRMDYLPPADDPAAVLADPANAFISRYALGRDYHKTVRRRLRQLAERIAATIDGFKYRVFVDSAPVMEKPLAAKGGLGWIGKHTNLLSREAGSWFFLAELYTDLPLPLDSPVKDHCGRCQACIEICPTGAIVAPYRLDARLCVSYLTIELPGPIPEALRPQIGNRIYGCDDCQLVCPWNRFAAPTLEVDFLPRHGLDAATLIELFRWSEATFLTRTQGSAIRRIGWERWLRNIAVALGNAPSNTVVVQALRTRRNHASPLVREHVSWALARHQAAANCSD
jgi:epoxyqueuosine reductase